MPAQTPRRIVVGTFPLPLSIVSHNARAHTAAEKGDRGGLDFRETGYSCIGGGGEADTHP